MIQLVGQQPHVESGWCTGTRHSGLWSGQFKSEENIKDRHFSIVFSGFLFPQICWILHFLLTASFPQVKCKNGYSQVLMWVKSYWCCYSITGENFPYFFGHIKYQSCTNMDLLADFVVWLITSLQEMQRANVLTSHSSGFKISFLTKGCLSYLVVLLLCVVV